MSIPTASTGTPPALSVVIVRFAGGDAIVRTLTSLAPQVARVAGETLVACRAGDEPTDEMRRRFPHVRWIAGDGSASPARLRALAVRASTGGIVACTEDHCTPTEDWCARVLAAHVGATAIVGGAIDKAPSSDGSAWAAYLLDYARYMSPLPVGPAAYASDCNVSYPRAELDAIEPQWRDEFHETTVHWALHARGTPVLLDPTLVVLQHRDVVLADYLVERREHGRTFALTRVAAASLAARVRFALTALLLPPVILLRVRRVLATRGATGSVPASAWGPLARAALAWSVGEWQGYWSGK